MSSQEEVAHRRHHRAVVAAGGEYARLLRAAGEGAAAACGAAAFIVDASLGRDDAGLAAAIALELPIEPEPRLKMGDLAATLGQFTAEDFRAHVRMDKSTFDYIHERIADHDVFMNYEGRPQTQVREQLFVALWHCAGGASYRMDAQTTGLSESTVWLSVQRVAKAVIDRFGALVRWYDTDEEKRAMAARFEAKAEVPGIIGAVDGSLIPCKAVPGTGVAMCDRYGGHSMLLHAVVDADCKFRAIATRIPGAFGDSRAYQMTDLYRHREIAIGDGFRLAGDAAFSLGHYLLTRFTGKTGVKERDLPVAQQIFNKCLSRVRVHVEQAFGILKGRWRILTVPAQYATQDGMAAVIQLCVTLHNICMEVGDPAPPMEPGVLLLADIFAQQHLEAAIDDESGLGRAERDAVARVLAQLYELVPQLSSDGRPNGAMELRRLPGSGHAAAAAAYAALSAPPPMAAATVGPDAANPWWNGAGSQAAPSAAGADETC
jgi:hypothetical protein